MPLQLPMGHGNSHIIILVAEDRIDGYELPVCSPTAVVESSKVLKGQRIPLQSEPRYLIRPLRIRNASFMQRSG